MNVNALELGHKRTRKEIGIRVTAPAALLDACVLYPASIRDLLLQLAQNGAFHAKWSKQIETEWLHNLLLNQKDLNQDFLERTVQLMRDAILNWEAIPDAEIENKRM